MGEALAQMEADVVEEYKRTNVLNAIEDLRARMSQPKQGQIDFEKSPAFLETLAKMEPDRRDVFINQLTLMKATINPNES